MIDRILEITSPVTLQKDYGRLIIKRDKEKIDTVTLDDISAIILHPVAAIISAAILADFAARNIPVIIIGPDYLPIGELVPFSSHYLSAKRMESQLALPSPARKQAWQNIISAKIHMQAEALKIVGEKEVSHLLIETARNVRSGDKTNLEAYAARLYFKGLFGNSFVRDRSSGGINSMLNYGYTIIRAAAARQLAAAGLNLGISLFHHNIYNPFRLADDLMEPYRPYVDLRVHAIFESGQIEVDPSVKKSLTSLLRLDIPTNKGISPLGIALGHAANSLATYYLEPTKSLDIPKAHNSNLLSAYSLAE